MENKMNATTADKLNEYIQQHGLDPSGYDVTEATDDEPGYACWCIGQMVTVSKSTEGRILAWAPYGCLMEIETEAPLNVLAAVCDHRYLTAYTTPDPATGQPDYPCNGDLDPELEKLGFESAGIWH